MDVKTFTSQDGWYSLTLPAGWEEYDDGNKDTHAFFHAKTWTGNLRITTLHWTNLAGEDKATELVHQEAEENEGASLIKMGAFDCAHYKTYVENNGGEMIIYYWIFGKKNSLFICSYTTAREHEGNKENEVKEVERIIRSIRIN